jgi:hypothetical protein
MPNDESSIFKYLRFHIDNSIMNKYTKTSNEKNVFDPISSDITNDPIITICNHSFDRMLLFEWLQNKRNCPLCRHEFY